MRVLGYGLVSTSTTFVESPPAEADLRLLEALGGVSSFMGFRGSRGRLSGFNSRVMRCDFGGIGGRVFAVQEKTSRHRCRTFHDSRSWLKGKVLGKGTEASAAGDCKGCPRGRGGGRGGWTPVVAGETRPPSIPRPGSKTPEASGLGRLSCCLL